VGRLRAAALIYWVMNAAIFGLGVILVVSMGALVCHIVGLQLAFAPPRRYRLFLSRAMHKL
jgi:hypothetical protein